MSGSPAGPSAPGVTGNPVHRCPDCQAIWSRPPLTSRQLQLLRAIAADIRTYGRAPTIAELEQAFNLSAGTIHGHLAMLEWKRYIRREPYRERAITLIEPVP